MKLKFLILATLLISCNVSDSNNGLPNDGLPNDAGEDVKTDTPEPDAKKDLSKDMSEDIPNKTDSDVPSCGDGIINGEEECDGTELDGGTCPAGMSGQLACNSECEFDTSNCRGFAAVSAGADQVCGLLIDATVKCVDKNGMNPSTPPTNAKFKKISVGNEFSCGIKGGNKLECWDGAGIDTSGIAIVEDVKDVSVGSHICLIHQSDKVSCFLSDTRRPLTDSFSKISAGNDFACGIEKDSKEIKCWALIRDTAKFFLPEAIEGTFDEITVGTLPGRVGNYVCGIKDGSVICSNALVSAAPTVGMIKIDAGNGGVCLLDKTNNAECKFKVSNVPAEELSDISAGDEFACGIVKDSGIIKCWGDGITSFKLEP